MYLYFEQLIQDMKNSFQIQTYHIQPSALITEFALLPEFGRQKLDPLDRNTVYICEYRKLRRIEHFTNGVPLICLVEKDAQPDQFYFGARPVVVVYRSTIQEVLLFLSNHIYSYGRKSSDILEISQILLHCKTAEELMDCGYHVLGNPIVITDDIQKVLAYTPPAIVRNSLYNDIMSMEYLPVGHPDRDSIDSYWETGDVPFLNEGEGAAPGIICKELTIGGSTKGFLHVLQFNRRFHEDDPHIVALLGNLLTIHLWYRQQYIQPGKEGQISQYFRDILDDKCSDADKLLQRQKMIGIELKSYLRTIIIVAKKDVDGRRVSFQEMAAELAKNGRTAIRSYIKIQSTL